MGVCHEAKVVFVRVPKTASSSMSTFRWLGGSAPHTPASQMRRQLGPSAWRNYFKFAFVRDPADRFLSAFYHYVRRPPKPQERTYAKAYAAIQRLLRWGPDAPSRLALMLAEFQDVPALQPQSFFIDLRLDFVGRYEYLESDWREACRLAGQPADPLPRRNAAPRHLGAALAPAALESLRRVYAEDYARWYA